MRRLKLARTAALAPALALVVVLQACVSSANRAATTKCVEIVGAERSTRGDAPQDLPTPELFGVNVLFFEPDAHFAAELGLMYSDFNDDAPQHLYQELHVGMRWYPAPNRSVLQPYVGTGVLFLIEAGNKDDRRQDYNDIDSENDSWGDDVIEVLLSASDVGAYFGAGLELSAGPMYLGAGARALLADGVDDFDAHDDAFAVELALSVGLRF